MSFLGFVSNIYSVVKYVYNDEAFMGQKGGSSFMLVKQNVSVADLKESYSTVFRRVGSNL